MYPSEETPFEVPKVLDRLPVVDSSHVHRLANELAGRFGEETTARLEPSWQSVVRLEVDGRVCYLSVSGNQLAIQACQALLALLPPEQRTLLTGTRTTTAKLHISLERDPV